MLTQTDLIKKHRIMVRGNLGQHILADGNVAKKIVDLLDLKEGDHVLEIGPGLGALTWKIFEFPIHYTAIEKDARFLHILKEEARSFVMPDLIPASPAGRRHPMDESRVEPGMTRAQVQSTNWIHGDILKIDLESIFQKAEGGAQFKVVSNLPYYITAPILFKIMDCRKWVSCSVLMMQKEVASRLHASPGSKDYGRLSLGIQYAAEVEKAFDVSAGCFTPKPRVDSSVVTIKFKAQKPLSSELEEKELFQLIQTAFSQRRKTLANLLVQGGQVASRVEAVQILEKSGLNPEIRGEKLSLKDFLVLSENLRGIPSKITKTQDTITKQ